MALKKFIIGIAAVTAIMTVLAIIFQSPTNPKAWWPATVFVYTISPLLIVSGAELKPATDVLKEYLSFKNIDWKNTILLIIGTAILYPLIKLAAVYLAGNAAGINIFGKITGTGTYEVFDLFSINTAANGGAFLLFLLNITFSLVAGTITGILGNIGSEIGWRGFLPRHLPENKRTKPLAVAIIWTVWGIPFCIGAANGFSSCLVFKFITNTAMSYFLIEVIRKTGSVWVSAATIGIMQVSMFFPMHIAGSTFGQILLSALATVCLWALSSRLLPDRHAAC
ncbi:type II CAAX prenyl endopeptidase Rce1 family protein [Muribaculum sp.]|jgi:hypothetical protein|uniref:CPBP family glutamic-type intramembrane protease n=1 Tax=Muribaculum sp. TaxID=1918611 RepID=UPI00257D0A6F|nr:CPBP family glutamic-type intramembrane protease [Muribaculum sp.]